MINSVDCYVRCRQHLPASFALGAQKQFLHIVGCRAWGSFARRLGVEARAITMATRDKPAAAAKSAKSAMGKYTIELFGGKDLKAAVKVYQA